MNHGDPRAAEFVQYCPHYKTPPLTACLQESAEAAEAVRAHLVALRDADIDSHGREAAAERPV